MFRYKDRKIQYIYSYAVNKISVWSLVNHYQYEIYDDSKYDGKITNFDDIPSKALTILIPLNEYNLNQALLILEELLSNTDQAIIY